MHRLCDTLDGFGGGWTKAQILKIMRDSRNGSYATMGGCMWVIAKSASIACIGAPPPDDKTTEIDLERYSQYVMEMYELIRQDQELCQSLRRRGRRRVSLAAVLRLLEAKLGFLRRHRRVLPCG